LVPSKRHDVDRRAAAGPTKLSTAVDNHFGPLRQPRSFTTWTDLLRSIVLPQGQAARHGARRARAIGSIDQQQLGVVLAAMFRDLPRLSSRTRLGGFGSSRCRRRLSPAILPFGRRCFFQRFYGVVKSARIPRGQLKLTVPPAGRRRAALRRWAQQACGNQQPQFIQRERPWPALNARRFTPDLQPRVTCSRRHLGRRAPEE